MIENNNTSKNTIGIFITSLDDDYNEMLCKGFEDYAKENDVNAIYVIGGPLHVSFHPYEAHSNILYDLIDTTNVDGLIISSASLGVFTTEIKLREFVQKYSNLPIISLGTKLQDTTNILIDNRQGMRDLIRHIIEGHNARRIAFIKGSEGNYDAKIRYQAYKEILNEFKIPIEEELIFQGNFTLLSGKFCTSTLLNKGIQFDAIVAANDAMALGAIQELKKRGVNIPEDALVTGFDNTFTSSFSNPPLTTIKQPVYQQGIEAMKKIISMIKDKHRSEDIVLPTELIIRKSCGCIPESSAESIINAYKNSDDSKNDDLSIDLDKIITEIQKSNIYENFKMNPILVQDLLTTFINEITGKNENIFLNKFQGLVEDIIPYDQDLKDWIDITKMFQKFSLFYRSNKDCQSKSEKILEKARKIINNTIEQFEAYQSNKMDLNIKNLVNAIDLLNSNFVLSEINSIACKTLPKLGFNYIYASLFDEENLPSNNSKLIIACDSQDDFQLSKDGFIYPTKKLIPDNIFNKKKRYSFIIQSLIFKNEVPYGFFIFNYNPELIHFYINRHLSNALKGAFIYKELNKIKSK
ncbi:MAG: substrate-binding domain-containing protein [Candidatus Lokiarchaeota archaeon]|nr:substrate-binding domain-containing protein [Candidatus Lokiarchaeota archaeon]